MYIDTAEMPQTGQFIQLWRVDGSEKVWSMTYKWVNGNIKHYEPETDTWVYSGAEYDNCRSREDNRNGRYIISSLHPQADELMEKT